MSLSDVCSQSGSAFNENEEDYGYEVARILRKLADQFEQGETPILAMDINGNRVVKIDYEED